MDFINSIGWARGMERVFIDLAEGNEVFLKILDARFNFYYETQELILKEARGWLTLPMQGKIWETRGGP